MEAYATALTYAFPFFTILIVIEVIGAFLMKKSVYRGMDTISSLSSGLTNTLKALMGLTIVIISYDWMLSKFAMFSIESSVWLFVLAFIGHDFVSYWQHRFNHKINLFWNRHIVHHSSEEFNLSCALRQTVSAIVQIYFFLYIPLAILGIPTAIVAGVGALHLFAQFWYHTRLINRMGFLEHIIVTPSHHRVHHAINKEYIDKNFAAIFIVWDKWFGTFQEELADVPPVYGTIKPVNTWNPLLINFMHVWMLIKDAWRTQSFVDKIRIWFMPTGWRPEDVKEKYPINIIEDVYARPKYETPHSNLLLAWSWFQLIFHNLLIYYMLFHIAKFPFIDVFLHCGFLMLSVFAFTTLMDRHKLAVPFEGIKLVLGLLLVYQMNGWYLMDEKIFGGATLLLIIYFFISFLMTIYFTWIEKTADQQAASPIYESSDSFFKTP